MRTRFILIQTSHAGNVGGAARAMKVMGFDDLVLVAPRWPNVLRKDETIQRASGANDVLAKARIVETLDEALEGVSHLCATAMTPRDFGPPTRAPREHFAQFLAGAAAPDAVRPEGIAFLFGSERFGMRQRGRLPLPRLPVDPHQARASARSTKVMNKQGITTILDASTDIETMTAYQTLSKNGGLTLHPHFAVLIDPDKEPDNKKSIAELIRQKQIFDQGTQKIIPSLSVHTPKIFLDGTVAMPSMTGNMLEPYFENHGTSENPHWRPGNNKGPKTYLSHDNLLDIMTQLSDLDIDTHLHADGDGAVNLALNATSSFLKARPNSKTRTAIAHAESVSPQDFARFGELGALPILSFQWGKPAGDTWEGAKDILGPARHAIFEPQGLLEIYGAKIVFGSDWPVDPLNEWHALEVVLTRMADGEGRKKYPMRLGVDPALSLETALKAMTINARDSPRARAGPSPAPRAGARARPGRRRAPLPARPRPPARGRAGAGARAPAARRRAGSQAALRQRVARDRRRRACAPSRRRRDRRLPAVREDQLVERRGRLQADARPPPQEGRAGGGAHAQGGARHLPAPARLPAPQAARVVGARQARPLIADRADPRRYHRPMPLCRGCKDEVDSLVTVTVDGKKQKLCEDCADRAREEGVVARESESVIQGMMGYKGRR